MGPKGRQGEEECRGGVEEGAGPREEGGPLGKWPTGKGESGGGFIGWKWGLCCAAQVSASAVNRNIR